MSSPTTWGLAAALAAMAGAACSNGTIAPPGDAKRFDPDHSIPQVMAFAGPGAVLKAYTFQYVRSDGTMDLETDVYMAHASYELLVPATSDPSKPIGAGGFVGAGFQHVNVSVFAPGQRRRETTNHVKRDYIHQGMVRNLQNVEQGALPNIARPTCRPGTLWQAAVQKGAPSSAVARISWALDEYTLAIDGTAVSLRFDATCRLKA